jgi:nucleotide-binding universal stress UspA family protein
VYQKALVALDGSPEAEAIIPFLVTVAGPADVEVTLLRVLPTGELQDAHQGRLDAEEYLAPLAAELRARGVRANTAVRHGDPVSEILAGATEAGADLIAMTTHGRSGLRRVLVGSVAEAVLGRAQVPVFLMRQTATQVDERAVRRGRPGQGPRGEPPSTATGAGRS